jgi:sigma-B regulation protein RsbU (phosphoserine phosphatase)
VKILLIEDDPAIRRLHSRLLSLAGHEVIEASDGEAGWEIISQGEISFIVSDWLMPNLSGTDLCRRIRSECLDHYVYVILCTAKGEKSDLIEGMDAGADDFLVKPISQEELRVRVRAGERILKLERGLAERNAQMAAANSELRAAYDLIEGDLKAAAWMQENLLPPSSLDARCTTGKWYFRPSSYVAGDIHNCFNLDDNHVGFYMLDVAGHGVPAAMLSVTLSMVLTPDASLGSPLKQHDPVTGTFTVSTPETAVNELNRRFQSKDDRFFTMLYGVLDTRTLTLSLAQAGHPDPILLRATGEVTRLGTGGMPLGIFPVIDFDCLDISLNSGDRLVLYSDGVTECANSTSDLFGEDRLVATIEAHKTESLDAILQGIETDLDAWRGDVEYRDDVSVMILEFTGRQTR